MWDSVIFVLSVGSNVLKNLLLVKQVDDSPTIHWLREFWYLSCSNLNRVADWWGKFSLRAAIQNERKGDLAGKPVLWSFLLHQSSTFTKRWVFQASPRRIVFVKNSEVKNISASNLASGIWTNDKFILVLSRGYQNYLNKGLFLIQPAVRRVRKDLKFGCRIKKVWLRTST